MRGPSCRECGNHGPKANLVAIGNGAHVCKWQEGCERRATKNQYRQAEYERNAEQAIRDATAVCPNCGSDQPHLIRRIDPATGEQVGDPMFWSGRGQFGSQSSEWSKKRHPSSLELTPEEIESARQFFFGDPILPIDPEEPF